ncbi:MAG: rhodanese-like domain-containing protein [Gemmatimonadota bacterium]
MFFRQIFEEKLAQYAYLVGCQRTGEALVIDPMRDVARYRKIAEEEGLRLVAATETHIHADFLSGIRELAELHGVKAYLSAEGGAGWEYTWPERGRHDVHFLKHGDHFRVGNIRIEAVHTPGHTPEHLSFLITDEGGGANEPMGIASGDFVFVGDLGRPDLLETAAGVEGAMEPSARRLWESATRFLELPDYLQVWPGHGAGSACGKALGAVPETTVGYERRFSPALDMVQRSQNDFVDFILTGQPEPPVYFAEMKRLNRDGAPVLGQIPRARRLDQAALTAALADTTRTVVDARVNRRDFMEGHLPGTLYAPFDKSFPTIVGSYVLPESEVVLIIEEAFIEEAILDLIRIGYDHVGAYVTPDVVESSSGLKAIDVIDITEMDRRQKAEGGLVLDVRRLDEFEASHVPGALNIAHTRLRVREAELPKDREILVHCRTGARAAPAVALLQRDGYDVVYVDGEFGSWRPTVAAKA